MAWKADQLEQFCLLTLTAIAITGALRFTEAVMVPLVFAAFIFAVLSPWIGWISRKFHLPRGLSVMLILSLVAVLSCLLVLWMAASISSFAMGFGVYKERFLTFAQDLALEARSFGFEVDPSGIRAELSKLPVFSWAGEITGALVNFIGNFLLVAMFLLFLLLGEKPVHKSSQLMDQILAQISKYILVKMIMAVGVGAVGYFTFLLIGAELAFLFAALSVVLSFVPNIGSIIAVALPFPVLLLQFGFGWELVVGVTIPGVFQFVLGNIVEPKVLGDTMDLHPVTVMAFLIFWGIIWGLPGMILAVPITAILRIILLRIDSTRSLAELMSGRFE